jgi:hypothetical protein
MKALFLLSALLSTPAHAATVKENDFTCVGTVMHNYNPQTRTRYAEGDNYQIVEATAEYPRACDIDTHTVSGKQILAVCHVGDTCIVRASGYSHNRNVWTISKVKSVRRAPEK